MQGSSPQFTVDAVQDFTVADDPQIARRTEGSVSVPCFLTNGCQPGGRFVLDRRGLPTQQGSTSFKYWCQIPRSAFDPAAPSKARPALAGHGLLGGASDEIDDDDVEAMSNEHNFVFCATDWAGFASQDLPFIASSVINDVSSFQAMTDRM